ncbi:MAG: hypothetical protein K2F92_01905 [Alistipes sp.]|nr:hypothetical protein [Alistipes sp.]
MIKKLLGMLFSAAVLGTIVLTILGRGNYRSMIWDDEPGVSHLIRSVVPMVSGLRTFSTTDTPADAETAPATDPIAMPAVSSEASQPLSSASRRAAVPSRVASDDDGPIRRAKKNADGEYEDYLDMPDSLECPDPLEQLNK